jgi:putative ABC transport system substrate-binding protein
MERNRLFKVFVSICAISMVILAPLSTGGCTDTEGIRIGLTQFATHPAADSGRLGFIDALADAGYEEGKNVTYDYQNPEGEATIEQSIAQKFVNDKVDMIFSFGSRITQQCVNAASNTDIPVVFCGITDPIAAGLISSFENHPENVTGTSDMIEVTSTIDLILQIVPGAKTIGTVYNAGEVNSVVLAEKFKEAASALGIDVSERTVSTTADVRSAAESLIGHVDAIWVGTDNTVISGLEALIKVCEDYSIPLFPSDDPSIERGGVACLGFDYYDLGYQAGEMAVKILKGTKASEISAELGNKFSYTINTTAAERYGVTIPQEIIDKALTNYGE